ncbi:hypothetical protein LCGC14_0813810 [marine sediment metagenome]|uniref:Peptidase C39-like domain-containing protein n=1 Tax=marine sediment metagenome TaxID=412755 RepID=A0A0F9PQH6_9ZZZZ
MTPQYQRIVDGDRGDCNQACVATITGLPLDDIPDGAGHKFGYYGALQDFLDEHGWVYIEIGPVLYWWLFYPLRNVPVIASVPSQAFEGRMHAVVACVDDSDRLVVLHDPNPGNGPYDLSLEGVPEGHSMLIRREGLPDGRRVP